LGVDGGEESMIVLGSHLNGRGSVDGKEKRGGGILTVMLAGCVGGKKRRVGMEVQNIRHRPRAAGYHLLRRH
jgi:hypothetical protein